MKILIVGGTGMLGSDCMEIFSSDCEVIAPTSSEMDIISWDGVIETLQDLTPEVVLNCAGFNDVDACETEDFKVKKLNVEGPRNLAQCSARFECRLVHISSDYVFDGQKMLPQPYFEDDFTNPVSAYGKSKRDSEVAVRDNSPNYMLVRTSWLYGKNGKNFIKSIVSKAVNEKDSVLTVVNDQFGAPTWTYRLALQIKEMLLRDCRGTYHATSEGFCSFYDYAKHILDKLNIKAVVEPCKMKDLNRPAARPANCILENRRLKKRGINILPDWKEDLDEFLKKWGEKIIKEAESQKYRK